jgi:hypothetical protein
MKRNWKFISLTVALVTLSISVSGWSAESIKETLGPRFSAPPQFHKGQRHPPRYRGEEAASALRYWNEVAIDASGLDHTPVAADEVRVFGEQYGPTRASRAMAIVHIAIFDAVNAIAGHHQSYTDLLPVSSDTSIHAAIAQAAHDTLVALFPSQVQKLNDFLAEDLGRIADGHKKAGGIQLGQNAATAILALRASDGSQHAEPRVGIDFITSNDPGKWRQDPISVIPLALGAHWGGVTPFVLKSGDQFRAPVPPSLDSPEYTMAFTEVKAIGGDGLVTPTVRTAEQTQIGIYWAYDGTPSLCAPPRLYNQIVAQIADERHANVVEFARLLALVNMAMADAGIAIWESKYHYQYWRPVTAIREADDGTGPAGKGDGNSATFGDLKFTPLGAPASNLNGPNFTPPFPAYPSGHAGFGGAIFQILRHFFQTDHIAFSFVSDEFDGETLDNEGHLRPLVHRSFSSLSQAEEENGQSRIYLGIHWVFDKTEGINQGRRVADYVFKHALEPLHEGDHDGHEH